MGRAEGRGRVERRKLVAHGRQVRPGATTVIQHHVNVALHDVSTYVKVTRHDVSDLL